MARVKVMLEFNEADYAGMDLALSAMSSHAIYQSQFPNARVMVMITTDRQSAWWPPIPEGIPPQQEVSTPRVTDDESW